MTALLLRGGHILTMDPDLGDFPEGDILLQNGRVAAVSSLLPTGDARVIDVRGQIVVPGFIDAHRHTWQSLLHGLSSDWSFAQYMRRVRGGLGGCFDAEDAYLANLIGGLESLSAGITTVVDHSHLQTSDDVSDALLRGLWDSGVGGYFAYAFQNSPDWLGDVKPTPESINLSLAGAPDADHDRRFLQARSRLAELDADGTGRLRLGAALPETAPYLPIDVVRPLLQRISALRPALLTGHWNAYQYEGRHVSTVGPLADEGPIGGVTVLSHCNQFSDGDLDVMARAGIGLVTTPSTEVGMGLGPLKARRLLEHGGAAALGVDTTCCVRADIIGQARTLLEAERYQASTAGTAPQQLAWSARGALDLATRIGAQTVGLGEEVGTLTPGKRANLAVIRPPALASVPAIDPAATLIFYSGPADVQTVLVDGEIRKSDGELIGVDTTKLAERSTTALRRILERYAAVPAEVVGNAWQGMF